MFPPLPPTAPERALNSVYGGCCAVGHRSRGGGEEGRGEGDKGVTETAQSLSGVTVAIPRVVG
jgi:hypothetical protein